MRCLAAVALLSFAAVVSADDCPRGLLTAERAVSMSGSGMIGDFNRDGRPDFAALADSDLLTFLNRGNGVFEPRPSLFEHTFTSSKLAEARDVNGDGNLDVVINSLNSIAMQPEHPLEGQRVSFVVHAQTARLNFSGPIIITENGTNLVPSETIKRYDTLSWTSQPLKAGHHVYTLRYEDFYAGDSQSGFEFDVSVPAAHRRTVR